MEMLVILTPAPTHYELIRRGLMAGKHVYTEKTMTVAIEGAAELLRLSEEKGLYLGFAPDTFLGAALQTGRKEEQGRQGNGISCVGYYLSDDEKQRKRGF